jgi:hypothetical protein
VAAAAAGTTMTLVVLAQGGGYRVVVPRLTWILPLPAIGAIAALAPRLRRRAPHSGSWR